ncbi:MAG: threonylcarbamoyl-AMP synthase [Myxococcales bacterium]|nr:threonylcarbamoyl-AMP synthase [Myxococcales bacterium]
MHDDYRTPKGTLVTFDPARAAEFVRNGQVVAFPTETVFGLGALALDANAVQGIFAAKVRPADNPLIVHGHTRGALDVAVDHWTDAARALGDGFWPGPLTVVVPRSTHVPNAVTAGLGTVGVRVPNHARALAFLAAVGAPVAAPSANRSGRPSATRLEDVLADLDGIIPCVLAEDAITTHGIESTVVDCTEAVPRVLRAGAIPLESVREVCPDATAVAADGSSGARSPGTLHPHYAPRARVTLVTGATELEGDAQTAWIGLREPPAPGPFASVVVCRDVADYAQRLFAFFRDADRAGLMRILCETVPDEGLGTALMDRLRRAAEARG